MKTGAYLVTYSVLSLEYKYTYHIHGVCLQLVTQCDVMISGVSKIMNAVMDFARALITRMNKTAVKLPNSYNHKLNFKCVVWIGSHSERPA